MAPTETAATPAVVGFAKVLTRPCPPRAPASFWAPSRPPRGPLPSLRPRRVTILSVSNVGVSFGATELFKNITFTVAEGERWGIIGRNGAGKTSIFKIITGDLIPTVGSVARKPGLRHALLDQHRAFEGATTVWEAGAAAWREVVALEQLIATLAIEMGELGDKVTDDFLERFGHHQERFRRSGRLRLPRPRGRGATRPWL